MRAHFCTSNGDVPAPTSSRITSERLVHALSRPCCRLTRPLKVERERERLCSSPMSARILSTCGRIRGRTRKWGGQSSVKERIHAEM